MQPAVVFSVTNGSLPVYGNGPCKIVSGNGGTWYVTAQPTAYPPIASAGVASVLCVRDPSETTQPNAFDIAEADSLIPLNVSYTNVPMPHVQALKQAQFNMQAYNAAVVINSWPAPLLVHCSSGDRASAAFAVYMIQFCGWPSAQAASFAQTQLALANALFIQQVNAYTQP